MFKYGNPGDVPKLYHMLMWMHCTIYMHHISHPVFADSVLACSHAQYKCICNQNSCLPMFLWHLWGTVEDCGGSSNFLLGNVASIQICEVNTKKCNIVKSSVILKETMLIYVQLDCKWHHMKGVLPLSQHWDTYWLTTMGKVFALLWMTHMTDKKTALAPATHSAKTGNLNLTQLRGNNFLK